MNNKVTLYIATHNKTGLKYFGKTNKYFNVEDLLKYYHGSGTYWKRHLEKHGDDVTMEIHKILDINSVQKEALNFSNEYDIVNSKEWANLVLEDGLGGGDRSKFIDYKEVHRKGSTTRNSSKYKNKIKDSYKSRGKKIKNTMISKEWKERVGNKVAKKFKKWANSESNVKGLSNAKLIGLKASKTKNSKEWKETVGKEAISKVKETKNSKEWKETIGKESIRKAKETKSTPEWKNNNKNYQINTIEVYNANNELVYLSENISFKIFCENNNLPCKMLKYSYNNNSKRIYSKSTKKEHIKFRDWYAIRKDKHDTQ